MPRKCAIVYWYQSPPVPGFTRVRAVALEDIQEPADGVQVHERAVYQVRFRKEPDEYLPGLLMEIQDDMRLGDLISHLYKVERSYELRGERWTRELGLQVEYALAAVPASSSSENRRRRRSKKSHPASPPRTYPSGTGSARNITTPSRTSTVHVSRDSDSSEIDSDLDTFHPVTKIIARQPAVAPPIRRPLTASGSRQFAYNATAAVMPPPMTVPKKRVLSPSSRENSRVRRSVTPSLRPRSSMQSDAEMVSGLNSQFRSISAARAASECTTTVEKSKRRGGRKSSAMTAEELYNREIPATIIPTELRDEDIIYTRDLLKDMCQLKTWKHALRFAMCQVFSTEELTTSTCTGHGIEYNVGRVLNQDNLHALYGLLGQACEYHDEKGPDWKKPDYKQLTTCISNQKYQLKTEGATKRLLAGS